MGKAPRRTPRRPPRRPQRTFRRAVAWAIVGLAAASGASFLIFGRAQDDHGRPPDFTMVAYQGEATLGGERVAFSSLAGHGRPVVLNFWAGLCPPCRAEMPGHQRVHDDLGGHILFIGVDLGPFTGLGSHDDARAFLRDNAITYAAAYAVDASPLQEYTVLGMPTTILFDVSGKIVSKHTGYLAEDQLRRLLEPLIAGAS